MPRLLRLLLVLLTASVPATAQDTTFRAPRTADGRPDLQGVWSFASGVPLQRPSKLAGKKFFFLLTSYFTFFAS